MRTSTRPAKRRFRHDGRVVRQSAYIRRSGARLASKHAGAGSIPARAILFCSTLGGSQQDLARPGAPFANAVCRYDECGRPVRDMPAGIKAMATHSAFHTADQRGSPVQGSECPVNRGRKRKSEIYRCSLTAPRNAIITAFWLSRTVADARIDCPSRTDFGDWVRAFFKEFGTIGDPKWLAHNSNRGTGKSAGDPITAQRSIRSPRQDHWDSNRKHAALNSSPGGPSLYGPRLFPD